MNGDLRNVTLRREGEDWFLTFCVEARLYGLAQLTQAHDTLVLAQVLVEHGAMQDALEIAEHGLLLTGELWTLPSGCEMKLPPRAMVIRAARAALVTLRELHSVDDNQALQTVAGDRWPTLRDDGSPIGGRQPLTLRAGSARSLCRKDCSTTPSPLPTERPTTTPWWNSNRCSDPAGSGLADTHGPSAGGADHG
jgi:hypothetical protein